MIKIVRYFFSLTATLLAFASFFQDAAAQIPTVQDCLGAIPVCTNEYNQPLSFQGTGNYPDEINPSQSCPRSCMDGEKNSVWYVISVKTGGLLSFVITPVSSADDYDWAVYNLNTMECSDIYNNAVFMQSSCNAAGGPSFQGPTGISSANGGSQNCNGGGNTNKWNADLPVNSGDTYVLCVSNWTMTQSGYLLDFSASTADIFDDIQAVIGSVNTDIGCAGATSLSFAFTENVKCLSVQPSDFLLTGPDGSQHIVTSVNGAGCQAGGEQEKFFTIEFYPPIYLDGTYTLGMVGSVTDLCTNVSGPHSFDFTVDLAPLPEVLNGPEDALVPIGGAATFTVETLGDTSFKWQYREPGGTFWSDLSETLPYSGSNTATLTIDPCTFDMGQFQYRCVVSGDCPPPTQSPAATLFVGDALAASATCSPEEICIGAQTQLFAIASGGNVQQPYTYLWSSPDGFTSTQQSPVVEPAITTTYTVLVDDGYNPTTAQVTVTVNPLPVANAGSDLEINHGTFTTLSGSASIGEPPFSYQWEPADSLWNPGLQNPATRKLSGSTLFSLVVTDGNNCVSLPDQVLISVVGGPLAVSPQALPAQVCFGESANLYALPSGGEFTDYLYTWEADGVEFSTDQNPLVTPGETTTYTVTLTDGFNQVSKSVDVTVHPLPVVELIRPEFHIVNGAVQECVFDTISLDAGNPGSAYLWSDGADTPAIEIATSGLSFDFQEHWVRVTNNLTGCVSSDTVMVMFTFVECSYGIESLDRNDLVKVYPNPASREITIAVDGLPDDFSVMLTDLSGRTIMSEEFRKAEAGVSLFTMDVSGLQTSVFLIKIQSENVNVVKKLIVSH